MRRSRVLLAVRHALDALRLPPGSTIVSALSGGADSVALLHALSVEAGPRGFRLLAAHLDHRLRDGSAADADACRALCASLGVPLRTAEADVPARARRDGDGIEQAARLERHAFLRQVRQEEGAAVVALAHTRDDQAETLLLRLLRGAGRRGLGAMRTRVRGLWRPLLPVSRADVLAHLAAAGLGWREDPSNRDLRFARNRVRHELLPYLEEHFNPHVRATLARSAGVLADEADALDAAAARLARRAHAEDPGGPALVRSVLRAAAPSVAALAIRRLLDEAGGLRDVGASHVRRLLALVNAPGASGRRLPLPGGRVALVRFDRLVIARTQAPAPAFAALLDVPGRVDLPDGRTLRAEETASAAAGSARDAIVAASSAALEVRTRRPGDRIRSHGRDISLKRYLLDRRVPADLRPGLPLVADGSRVVWVPGLPVEPPAGPGRLIHLHVTPAERLR
ncbi:MAG: tRNA lysidine(34) synthetase TilS [Vicinamibacteria bacterium]